MPEQAESADQPQLAPITRYRRLPAPTRAQLRARRAYRRAIRRSRNPFRFSLRSLAFTLLLAILTAMLMFSLVFALRGAPAASSLEPIIEVDPAPIRLDDAGQAGALQSTPGALRADHSGGGNAGEPGPDRTADPDSPHHQHTRSLGRRLASGGAWRRQ